MSIKSKKHVLLINQSIGELFKDIILSIPRSKNISIFSGNKILNLENKISHHKGINYNKSSILSRLLTWLVFAIEILIFILIKRRKYSNVLIVSNPPIAPIIGLFTKSTYSILIYDLYPEIIKNKYPKITSSFPFALIFWIWSKLNKLTFEKAKYIFCLTNEMKILTN